MKIVETSPTRIDLAGGTLDLWPLYSFLGKAKTINMAIDICTTVELESSSSGIEIDSRDLNVKSNFPNLESFLNSQDRTLDLIKEVVRFISPKQAFRLSLSSQSPVGGGLGGSSSMTISLLRAFYKFTSQVLPKVDSLVHIAHNLEAKVLNTPTGTQDYYPAQNGGINILTYCPTGITCEVLPVPADFAKRCLLVYTGRSHHSGINNFEVLKSAVARDKNTMDALNDLAEISDDLVDTFKSQSWDELGALFDREFAARVRLSSGFNSPEISILKEWADRNQCHTKICGAGGGGCVLIWTRSQERQSLVSQLVAMKFQVLDFQLSPPRAH